MSLAKAWHVMIRLASHRDARGRQRPPRRLCLEPLEDRSLPSGYTITDIGVVRSVSGINNASVVQVVGSNAKDHAFVWDSIHGMQDLGTIGSDPSSWATGISNAGQVIGSSETVTEKFQKKTGYPYFVVTETGFLWTSSQGMKNLGQSAYPTGINASGEVGGSVAPSNQSSLTQAAVLKSNKWTQLDTLPGGKSSSGRGVNDYGQLVGDGNLCSGSTRRYAFLWTPSSTNGTAGAMIDLGTLSSSFDSSEAAAIDGKGLVTGSSSNTSTGTARTLCGGRRPQMGRPAA